MKACSAATTLDVNCDKKPELNGARMDVALAGNDTITTYVCRGFYPATLPRSLERIHLEQGHDRSCNAGDWGVPQLLIRLQQCPALTKIDISVREWAEVPLVLSKKSLSGLVLPSFERLHLHIDARHQCYLDLTWLALPRSFALDLQYHEGGWNGYSAEWCDVE